MSEEFAVETAPEAAAETAAGAAASLGEPTAAEKSAFEAKMTASMVENGLSQEQAASLTQAYQAEIKRALSEDDARYETEKAEALALFKPAELETARRAFRLSQVPEAIAVAIERAIGVKTAVEMFGRLGRALAEDRLAARAGGAVEDARGQVSRLLADPAFCRRYQRGDADALREISELSRQAVK